MTHDLSRRDLLKGASALAVMAGGIGALVGDVYAHSQKSLTTQFFDLLKQNPNITYNQKRGEYAVTANLGNVDVAVSHPAIIVEAKGVDGKVYQRPVPDRTKPLTLTWGEKTPPGSGYDIVDANHDGAPEGYYLRGTSRLEYIGLINDPDGQKTFGQRFNPGMKALIDVIKSAKKHQ